MLTRAIKPDSRKSQRRMKFFLAIRPESSTTLPELSEKVGQKWVAEPSREATPTKSIRTSSTVCHLRKENNSNVNLRQESEGLVCI